MTFEPLVATSRLAIRFATAADAATVLGFVRALAGYTRTEHQVVPDEAALHAALSGPRPAAEVLLAELAGVAIGFAALFQNYSTFLGRPGFYLEDLFVVPEARGQGAGLALMSAVAQVAVDRGYGRIEWAVLDWNQRAQAFYGALGAEPLADRSVHRIVGPPLVELASRWPGSIATR